MIKNGLRAASYWLLVAVVGCYVAAGLALWMAFALAWRLFCVPGRLLDRLTQPRSMRSRG